MSEFGDYFYDFAQRCQKQQNQTIPPPRPWMIYPFKEGYLVFKLKDNHIKHQYFTDHDQIEDFIQDVCLLWTQQCQQSIINNPILRVAQQKMYNGKDSK